MKKIILKIRKKITPHQFIKSHAKFDFGKLLHQNSSFHTSQVLCASKSWKYQVAKNRIEQIEKKNSIMADFSDRSHHTKINKLQKLIVSH